MEEATDNNGFLGQFVEAVASGRTLTPDDLPMVEALTRLYPSFTLPAAMMLQCAGLPDDVRRRLSATVAVNAPDRMSLMKLVDPDGHRFASFYPVEEANPTPTTEAAIDTFLDQYGTIDPHEQQLLERLIFNPVADYSQVLARDAAEVGGPVSEQDAMLDAFLARQGEAVRRAEELTARPQRPSEPALPKPDAETPLSESLAKIFVRQGRYDKAYEIIHQLSLNFPKKSIYFADQLRFLKKLIIVSRANADLKTNNKNHNR